MAGALIFRQEHGSVDRSNAMSSGAEFYRQEHAHRSIAVLPFSGRSTALSQSDRSIVLATEAWFRRQEPCYVDRSIVLSTRACPQEHCGVDGNIVLSE